MRSVLLILLAALLSARAGAEVTSVADSGFRVAGSALTEAPPERVFRALGQPGKWWDSQHSWSGDARNMRLDLRVGGCFCEAVPAEHGMVEHGRVIALSRNKTMRLQALLGPMQFEGVSGVLEWSLKPEGSGTRISVSYAVGGFLRAGAKEVAPLVDRVLNMQLQRLANFAR